MNDIKFGDVVKLKDGYHYLCLGEHCFLRLEDVKIETCIIKDIEPDDMPYEKLGNYSNISLNDLSNLFNNSITKRIKN